MLIQQTHVERIGPSMQEDDRDFGWLFWFVPYLLGVGVTMLIGGPAAGLTAKGSALFGAIAIPCIALIMIVILLSIVTTFDWAVADRWLLIAPVGVILPLVLAWSLAKWFDLSILRTALLLIALPGVTFLVVIVLFAVVILSVMVVINCSPSNIRKQREAQRAFERFCERTVDDLCADIEGRIQSDSAVTQTIPAEYLSEMLDQLHPSIREYFERFGRLEIKKEDETLVIDPAAIKLVESEWEEAHYRLKLSERGPSIRFPDSGQIRVFIPPKYVEVLPTIYHAAIFILGSAPNSEVLLD